MNFSIFKEILPLWFFQKLGLDKKFAIKVLGWELDRDQWGWWTGGDHYHFHVGKYGIIYPRDYRTLKKVFEHIRFAFLMRYSSLFRQA